MSTFGFKRLGFLPVLLVGLLFVGESVTAVPSDDMADTFCTIARWKSKGLSASFDVHEATQRAALDHAAGLPFALAFPDVAAYRTQVESLTNQVCAAATTEDAKQALAGMDSTRQAFQAELRDSRERRMKSAMDLLSAWVKEQMKPFEEDARAANRPLIEAESQRLIREDAQAQALNQRLKELRQQQQGGDVIAQAEAELRAHMERLMQPFREQLRQQTEARLKAKAQEMGGPHGDRIEAIVALFKGERSQLGAYRANREAEWKQVWQEVVARRKAIILAEMDARIDEATARIRARASEAQADSDQHGTAMLLDAIGRARAALASSLDAALSSGKHDAVEKVVADFWRSWAEGMCAATRARLDTLSGQVNENLEQLRSVQNPAAEVQGAITTGTTLLGDIGGVVLTCGSLGEKPLQQVGLALQRVEPSAEAFKQALAAVKAAGQP